MSRGQKSQDEGKDEDEEEEAMDLSSRKDQPSVVDVATEELSSAKTLPPPTPESNCSLCCCSSTSNMIMLAWSRPRMECTPVAAEYIVAEAMHEDPPAREPEVSIGIDLGTSTFSVAAWRSGGVDVLVTEHGHRHVRSHVLFSDLAGVSSVGNASEDELWSGSAIFNVKRLVGRMDADPVVQAARDTYPFLVECLDIGVKPFLGALAKDVWRSTTPEEVLALHFMQARAIAEAHLGKVVRSAVITVPVSFNRFQLTRVERACTLAGLQVARLMPEPTSAALVYSQLMQQQGSAATDSGSEKLALIFNMGAGYTDVALTATAGGVSQIRGLAGEALGGEELLQNLVRCLLPEMLAQLGESPSSKSLSVATGRLRFSAQRAMEELSVQAEAVVEVVLGANRVFQRTVTRDTFNELNAGIYQRCLELVLGCLRDAEVEPDSISDVIAVGGCSNIPAVRNSLQAVFGDKKEVLFNAAGLDALEAAVRGAALEGAIMAGLTDPSGNLDLLTIQAMPLSVGISIRGGEFLSILKKNSAIPARRDTVVTTCHDNQKDVLVAVYEGESKLVRHNHLLGFFKLSGIPGAPKGVPVVSICLDVDASNVLRVLAGAYVPDSNQPAVQLREVRMPTVDDGHGWCVEALFKKHGDSMDVALPQ